MSGKSLVLHCTFAVSVLGLNPVLAFAQTVVEVPVPNYGPIVRGDTNLYFVGSTTIVNGMTIEGVSLNNPNLCPYYQPGIPELIAYGSDGTLWSSARCLSLIAGRPPVNSAVLSNGMGATLISTQPTDLIVGPNGNAWFAGGPIGRVTPDLNVTLFSVPGGGAVGLAVGDDGNIWFTDPYDGRIGKITADGTVTAYHLPTAGRRPGFITSGADGNLWFTESDSQRPIRWIGRATLSGIITEYPVPTLSTDLGRITAGPDGNVWFTESGHLGFPANKIGRITPAGVITEFPTPSASDPGSKALGIAAGPDGNVWFTEPDKVGWVNLDPAVLALNSVHPFSITLAATDQRTGRAGTGVATQVNDLWGYFSIPAITGNPNNPEVFVKMLDGTALNGSYWFFYGGLTDLEYTLTVTEVSTGRQKTYTKPAGSECGGSDTAAFGP